MLQKSNYLRSPAAEVIEKRSFKVQFCKCLSIKELHFIDGRTSVAKKVQFGPSESVLGQSYRESDQKMGAN